MSSSENSLCASRVCVCVCVCVRACVRVFVLVCAHMSVSLSETQSRWSERVREFLEQPALLAVPMVICPATAWCTSVCCFEAYIFYELCVHTHMALKRRLGSYSWHARLRKYVFIHMYAHGNHGLHILFKA
jgi:hypothetical protein